MKYCHIEPLYLYISSCDFPWLLYVPSDDDLTFMEKLTEPPRAPVNWPVNQVRAEFNNIKGSVGLKKLVFI